MCESAILVIVVLFVGLPSSSHRLGRIDRGVGAKAFGDERGVLAHAVAGALDLDDDGVVKKPVEQRCGDHGIAEHVAPFAEATVGG